MKNNTININYVIKVLNLCQNILMKKTLIIIGILFLVVSCADKNQKTTLDASPQTDYKAAFNQFFASNRNSIITEEIADLKVDSVQWVKTLYKNINYSTLWVSDSITLNKDGIKLLETLSDAKVYGLDTKLYPINELREIQIELEKKTDKKSRYALLSRLEVLLSYEYMRFARHLN